MSATPRLPSGYPATPLTCRTEGRQPPDTTGPSISSTLPLAPEETLRPPSALAPVIPLSFLDAPQQRLYAFALYVLLWGWKLYDWLQVIEDGESSWWLFLKWILIDFAYIFGLPELRIPWLELSQFTVTSIFASHVMLNYILMFNIPVPLSAWLLAFLKVLYDRELSISEQNVKVSNILNNHSLIMGKQIINILPEGSAILNADNVPFCINAKSRPVAALPIYFNATVPAEIEIIRVDLDTNKEETIKVPSRDVNKLAKAIREQNADPVSTGFSWQFQAKKPGVYRLGKVLDEYKLQVHRVTRDSYVVPCPQARIKTTDLSQRCLGDLSDMSLEVVGTPPLRIGYRRTINGKNDGFHFQSLQPDGFISPLVQAPSDGAPTMHDEFWWARPCKVAVGLNESMTMSGEWEYSIQEVHDVFGNVVEYAKDGIHVQDKDLMQSFTVTQRPTVRMKGCDARNALKVAKGQAAELPVTLGLAGDLANTAHRVGWKFSPIDSLTDSGDHGGKVSVGSYSAKNSRDKPLVSQPGLYTLESIVSGNCQGQVDEPSSCLLLNPIEPQMSMTWQEIPDKCAGNSIGLRVDLDLVGTPPFAVRYDVMTHDSVESQVHRVSGLRCQLELIPKRAGRHRYVFKYIDDAVYTGMPLGSDKVLEQVVKPAASAVIRSPESTINACLDSQVEIDVDLVGDAPFNLEWEMVHEGKRKTERVAGIETSHFRLQTAKLAKGGEYIVALSSVEDKRGCRTFLQDQIKIAVRRQRPRAGFGLVERKHSIMAVESTEALQLPLRLQGEYPWTIGYRNVNESSRVQYMYALRVNDHLEVKTRGLYQLVSVKDSQCPGTVDAAASQFYVDWFPRPQIALVESASIATDKGVVSKQPVCEGDVDGFEVKLQGSPPYHVEYEIKHKSLQGSSAISHKSFDAALAKAAISVDTTKAGDYTYRFLGLADNLYDSDKDMEPLVVHQRVNAKPSATFAKPGQSFKYCMQEQEQEDRIPMTLGGVAPFYVEVEIKHQAGSPPDTYRIPSIELASFGMPIPRQHLRLGTQQLRIRKVRDAQGCQQKYDVGGPSVQVQLFDAPSIYPLESRDDFCVGERIAYTLSGTPPFDIAYDFHGRWNAKSQTTSFRRIADKPGEFTIRSISDKASECRAAVDVHKTIHALPSVRVSRGLQSRVDIHQGNEVDILFEFWGTPPFEFTYTRSTNAKKGQRTLLLETRHDVSYEHSKIVKASQEGTYEVVAIKDKYCSFSTQQGDKKEKRL
ncbi:hypothetical protein CDD81_2616 [Ophiocordyceps australis]|uniref:Nucleoporin POM152 n=1 Tax=Ophiocordyceps australis TaxID=1399860 RepID=A0A2C5XEK0_9HYPO|nr:hypothetical protein CDD81_2616 [Ophiocordyceps australis]